MNGDRGGNMPFAVIAVTILLLASAAGVVMAEHARSEGGIEEAMDGADALESSLDDVRSYVNQELGAIILDISLDDSLGTLDRRAEVFAERAGRWIDDRFPMKSGNVTVSLHSKEIMLTAEPMEIVSGNETVGGYIPSYLHGIGKLEVTASSGYGRSDCDIDISTDGSYALPLAAEQGSLFERMVADGGISVSQMMTYELQSLAQYRIINGYGAKSQYGKNGTDSILTRQDVKMAYDNALKLIGTMCFRDGDGDVICGSRDLAETMVGQEIWVNCSAFYGQVLMSVMDDLVLKWYDYLCGDILLDAFQDKFRPYKVAMDCLVRFITGEDPFSAEGYIERIMVSEGVNPDVYRTPGKGFTTVTVNGCTVKVKNPTKDIMDAGWIRYFNIHYSGNRDYIQDDIRYILNSAAQNMFSGNGYTKITLDPNDPGSFISKVADALYVQSAHINEEFSRNLMGVINKERTYDPFYSEIADTVMNHADSIADTETLRSRIADAFTKASGGEIDIETIMASQEVEDAVHRYVSKVYSDLSVYDAMRTVEGGSTSFILESMIEIASYGLSALDISGLIDGRADILLNEIVANMDMSPYSGPVELAETDYFILVDEAGNRTRESLRFEFNNDPVVSEPIIVREKCTHVTGFREDLSAAYSTTFSVSVRDIIDYRIECNGALSSAMGGDFTGAISGTVRNHIGLEISVASAWALAGVDYSTSETIVDDAFKLLWEYLEPVMEPLRQIMTIVMDTVDTLNRCVYEISRHVSDALVRMTDRMSDPMCLLTLWIEQNIERFLEDNMIDVFMSLNLSEQKVGFEYMGYRFEVKMDIASLYATTKTVFIATLSGPIAGMDTEVSIALKSKGELNAGNVYVIGKATVKSDDWKMKIALDPQLKAGKHLATISAEVMGADITAVLPDLEDYNELGFALSDVPGIGKVLQNIPVPGLGVNVGLDVGVSLKYTSPSAKGLIINEFESNPAGNDSKKEWVELLNNSSEEIDLTGYTLTAASDRSKTMTLSGSITPGEYLLIYPTFLMVNESGKLTKNGEGLTLKDAEGNIIDKTGVKKDTNDDGKTWQRSYDGASQWEFKEGTMGNSNGSYISSNFLTAEVAKELLLDSLHDAFSKVDSVTDAESLQNLLNETIKSAVNTVINKVAACLTEASIYVKVDVKDLTSTASTGLRIALRCDSDLVKDVLKFIAGKLEEMFLNIKNPYRIDPVSMFTDNIDLEVTFETEIKNPDMFSTAFDELPKADLGVTFRTNLSALTQIFGKDTGKPSVECGIRFIDCPIEGIPSRLSPKSGMDHDLWLIRVSIEWD